MRVPLLVGGKSNVLVFCYTGNGSSTFDPSISTSANVSVSWKPDDAPETVTSGTTHNFSYTPSAGYHVCIVRVNGGLGLVTAITANADALTAVKNLPKCRNCTSHSWYDNASLQIVLSDVATGNAINLSSCALANGSLSALSASGKTSLRLQSCTLVIGDLSMLNPLSIEIYLNGCTGVSPGSIAHLTAIRDIRIYSMWSDAASVDIVIESMWDARANYTYAAPSLQIGGTNPAPTGNYIAPEEGADWHNDGSKWIPLTPNAKAYDLANDVNTEGFNTWTISKN